MDLSVDSAGFQIKTRVKVTHPLDHFGQDSRSCLVKNAIVDEVQSEGSSSASVILRSALVRAQSLQYPSVTIDKVDL